MVAAYCFKTWNKAEWQPWESGIRQKFSLSVTCSAEQSISAMKYPQRQIHYTKVSEREEK